MARVKCGVKCVLSIHTPGGLGLGAVSHVLCVFILIDRLALLSINYLFVFNKLF